MYFDKCTFSWKSLVDEAVISVVRLKTVIIEDRSDRYKRANLLYFITSNIS